MAFLRSKSARKLGYESLENRETMAAGITATLNSAGVLNVIGTDNADTIRFQQTSGNISITGVTGTWSTSKVNSIVVDLKAGDDVVSLDSLGNGGNQSLQREVTVRSGAGRESVRAASGVSFNFNDAGHTFIVSTAGVATLDGKQVGNWFDTTVKDATLRSLGSSRYADKVLDRKDAIDILRDTEDGGTVDATEFADLKAIVSSQTLFGSLDYVWKLTSYVVSGNVANANYLGQALGNLASGNAGAKMEKLIGKWFLGLDRPTAAGTYKQAAGQLFVNGASYGDIQQGYLGDCYFMATLAEAAYKNPKIVNDMFIVNGDGTYTVRFYNAGKAEYVTVDSYLPTNSIGQLIYANVGAYAANPQNELWTALAEKAYVQLNEMGWERPGLPGSGKNAYSAIAGGYIYAAMGHVTGKATTPFNLLNFNALVTAFNQNKMIGFVSKVTPATSAVVGSHAYALVGINVTDQTITLMNPWGTSYGLVTLKWSDVAAHFAYFDTATV